MHGWVYDLKDGLVRHLDVSLSSRDDLAAALKKPWDKITAKLQSP